MKFILIVKVLSVRLAGPSDKLEQSPLNAFGCTIHVFHRRHRL